MQIDVVKKEWIYSFYSIFSSQQILPKKNRGGKLNEKKSIKIKFHE